MRLLSLDHVPSILSSERPDFALIDPAQRLYNAS